MTGKSNLNGSITVFLTMIMLIIVSLIMTTVESLRAYSISTYSQRALYAAMDSVLAEFYYPLFKEYHVFGLDAGYGSTTIQEDVISEKINEYMDYTFQPHKDIYFGNYNIPMKNFNIFDLETKSIGINKINTLMDFNGDLFINQAVDYSKYQLVGEGAKTLLEKISVLNSSEIKDLSTTQIIMNEKMIVEKGVSKIHDDIIILMQRLDGIVITNKGPKLSENGNLKINSNFIKKICNSQSIIVDPYPKNKWVSSSLKGNHVQPNNFINKGLAYVESLVENKRFKKEAELTYRFKSLINLDEIENIEERNQVIDDMKEAKDIIKECEKKEKEIIGDLNNHIREIKTLVYNISSIIDNTIPIVERLIVNQDKVTKQINSYEKILKASKGIIGNDLYSSFWNDYLELEKYKSTKLNNNSIHNFQGMKETLLNNKAVLDRVKGKLEHTVTGQEETWLRCKNDLLKVKDSLLKYSYNNLQLDYEALTKKEETIDCFTGINSVLGEGLLALVLENHDKSSDKKMDNINKELLPSYLAANNKHIEESMGDEFSNINESNSFDIFSTSLTGFSNNYDSENILLSTGDIVGKTILFQKYILDHFSSYNTDKKVNLVPSLDYEIEYILQGKDSDHENLKSIISTLLVFRMLMNTISLISNVDSNGEAKKIANLMVGFTGNPIIITITKTILLFLWGLAEGLIDIAALLKEKSVAIFKQAKDFELKLTELPLINKRYIQSKVSKMKKKKSLLNLTYSDYLNVLLLLKKKDIKTFRSLDLIQSNLQKNYEDSFLIQNSLYGFQVSAEFTMNPKFITIPFIQDIIGKGEKGYLHNTLMECSY